MGRNLKIRPRTIFLYFGLITMMSFFMFPIYWILVTSLQSGEEAFTRSVNLIPRAITLVNYVNLFTKGKFFIGDALINSLIVASCTTTVILLLSIFSSYAFARLKFEGSQIIFWLLLLTEMLPPISFLIPFYVLFRRAHLLNTRLALIIGYTAWLLPIVTWVLYGYFKSMPQDLEDAARIDGCTRVKALLKVVLPLATPGIVAAAIICFIFSIGEFILALTLLTRQTAFTLPLQVTRFVSKFTVEYGKLGASAVLTFIFPVIFAFIFQRYLVRGLTSGAIKE